MPTQELSEDRPARQPALVAGAGRACVHLESPRDGNACIVASLGPT